MGGTGLARLSDGQRACLRLVFHHMSSKDIARELNISPHTVDQRIKVAMQHLGATSRVEAAKLLAAHEHADPYQSVVYHSSDIADPGHVVEGSGAPEQVERTSDIPEKMVGDGGRTTVQTPSSAPLPRRNPWPFPHTAGDVNTLSTTERLAWIAMISIGSALAFGMILAGMDALSRLV